MCVHCVYIYILKCENDTTIEVFGDETREGGWEVKFRLVLFITQQY